MDISTTIKATLDASTLLTMSFYKNFDTLFNIMPMIVLLSFMFSFNGLNKNNEITISRSSGLSMIQFFTPAITFGFIVGILYTGILQPMAINGLQIYDKLWDKSENNQHTTVEISETGLWLRESLDKNNSRIINSQKMSEESLTFFNNEIILFDKAKNTTIVYKSDKMELVEKQWVLKNVTKFTNGEKQKLNQLTLKTKISKEYIKKLLRSVEKITFWDLNNYIEQLKKSKLNASEGIVTFNFLLSMPFLFVAIVFIAGFFSAQPAVRHSNKKNLRNGIIAGFGLYFYVNSSKFLVFISDINPHILGWIPTITMLFISIFLLFSSDKIKS